LSREERRAARLASRVGLRGQDIPKPGEHPAKVRRSWPHVLTVTRRTVRKDKFIDYTGEFHLELLLQLKIVPIMVPVARGTLSCLGQYRDLMDGLLLVEGEDIEPRHFKVGPANFKYLEKTHPLKDAIEIDLVQHALKHKIPVFGICRGSQLLNVVCGGTLYGDVQKELKSKRAHVDHHHYDSYRHPVELVSGTPVLRWYGRRELKVNSYHHQGVRELAPRFKPAAYADDGLIEAFYDPHSEFTVGFQFHPERMLKEYRGNRNVWRAFAKAVHHRFQSITQRPRPGRAAASEFDGQ